MKNLSIHIRVPIITLISENCTLYAVLNKKKIWSLIFYLRKRKLVFYDTTYILSIYSLWNKSLDNVDFPRGFLDIKVSLIFIHSTYLYL